MAPRSYGQYCGITTAVELFIHLEAYAGAARAFDSKQTAAAVSAEQA